MTHLRILVPTGFSLYNIGIERSPYSILPYIHTYGDGDSDLHSYTCMYIQDSSGQEFFIVFALYSGLGVLNDPRDRTISFLNS